MLNMIWRLAKDLDLPEFWPYGQFKASKIENEALKNNVLSSFRPVDENLRRHEQACSWTSLISRRVREISNYSSTLDFEHKFFLVPASSNFLGIRI